MASVKTQYKQNILLFVISILLILIIIFIIKTISLLRKPTATTIVKNGELIKYDEYVGYVIRDEEILDTNTYNGTITTNISDGYRVAKNGIILTCVSNREEKLINKIEELDTKIQDIMDNSQLIFPNDVKILDSEIKTKLYAAIKNKDDLYAVYEYKLGINESIKKKAKIVGDLSPAGSKLKELINERLKYESDLNNSKQVLKSPMAGLVSYRVDGYENIFTPKSFSGITLKDLEKIKSNVGQLVPIDTSKVKIVDNFACFIAIPMSIDESKDIHLNDIIKLRFDNTGNDIIQGTVEYVSEENSKRVIIVKIKSNIEELSKYRKINVDVVWWRDTGLKVPNNALKNVTTIDTENGEKEEIAVVTIQKSFYTETAYVKIIRQANGFSIVENCSEEELIKIGLREDEISAVQTLKLYNDVVLE